MKLRWVERQIVYGESKGVTYSRTDRVLQYWQDGYREMDVTFGDQPDEYIPSAWVDVPLEVEDASN